jgi:hypothetical protein
MGLGHVFNGGCSEINDGVADTAQMSGPNCEPLPASCGKACTTLPVFCCMQLMLLSTCIANLHLKQQGR